MAKSQISRLVCPSMDSPTIERRGVFPGRAGRHPFLILTTPSCRRTRARLPCPIAPEVRAMRSTRPRRRRSPVRLGAAVLLPLPKTPSHASIQPHPRWRAWNGGKRVSELGSKLGHDRSLLWRRLFATTLRGLPVRNCADLRFVQSRLRERIDENQIIDHMFN